MIRHPKLVAFGAGLISAIGFAPLSLWPVTLLCLALLVALIADAPSLRSAMTRGYVFGIGHFTIGLNWIAGAFRYQDTMPVWLGWVAVVTLALYIAVYPALAAGLAWRLATPVHGRRKITLALALIFAASWTFTEYLRATVFTGFAWNPLAVVWVPTPIDGLARWIGTYGLSAIVALVGGLVALAVTNYRSVGWLAGAAVLLPLAGHFVGDPTPADTARLIRIVQPNIDQKEKNDSAFDEASYRKTSGLTGKPGKVPRLILWPEAAVPYFLEEERWARERIAELLGPNDLILTGGDALVFSRDGKLAAARNSLFAMTPDARLIGRYDKAHLVPYGEYLPMRPILSAIGLSRLVPGDLDFLSGPGPQTLKLRGFGTVGVQICYEIIFSGQVIDSANRPDFLFNPSNDAWFGRWGPPQHLAQAQLRAIEEGMPVVRATPTGISAVIDANGKILAALPLGKAGFIETRLPAVAPPTLFARYGNILSFAFAFFLGLTGIALNRRHR